MFYVIGFECQRSYSNLISLDCTITVRSYIRCTGINKNSTVGRTAVYRVDVYKCR